MRGNSDSFMTKALRKRVIIQEKATLEENSVSKERLFCISYALFKKHGYIPILPKMGNG